MITIFDIFDILDILDKLGMLDILDMLETPGILDNFVFCILTIPIVTLFVKREQDMENQIKMLRGDCKTDMLISIPKMILITRIAIGRRLPRLLALARNDFLWIFLI